MNKLLGGVVLGSLLFAAISSALEPQCLGGTCDIDVVDAGLVFSNAKPVLVSNPNDGGVQPELLLHGRETMSAGSVAVTFNPAFSVAPDCGCTQIAAVPLACGTTAIPLTTGTTFAVATGASTSIMWRCTGPR